MCTVLGLLAKGDMNCAGDQITGNLFESNEEKKATLSTADLHKEPRPITETTGRGIVQTEAEKQAEEEARRRKQQEEEERLRAEEEELERKREEKRKNSWLHKTLSSLKNFGKKMVAEDEE